MGCEKHCSLLRKGQFV